VSVLNSIVLVLAVSCWGCSLAENYLDSDGPRYSAEYALEPASPSALPKLAIVTFNIKFGDEYELAGEELATNPTLSAADILLLQEMDAPRTNAIAARLGMNYVYYPGSVHENGRDFGNAVLSRWPIVGDKKLILPHRNPTDGRIRLAVRATVASPSGEITAYSVHTETPWLGPRARLEQAGAVLDDAQGSALTAIVGGDFNTSDPGAVGETVALFRDAGFTWASDGSGETAGERTLDHIFVKRLNALGTGAFNTEASDHRPEWAQVEFPISP
jgi:endonuclease/exonuclease/phosphatase family metal-dependent hydrolase